MEREGSLEPLELSGCYPLCLCASLNLLPLNAVEETQLPRSKERAGIKQVSSRSEHPSVSGRTRF